MHKLRPQASTASPVLSEVTIRSTPSGAHILRDGQEIGIATPTLTIRLPEGKTGLEARLDGYEGQSETIDNSPGHRGEINFVLRPLGQQLRIAGRGTLSLDGGPATALPMGAFSGELAAGNHTLHWHGRGGYDATFHVNVSDGVPATLAAPIHAVQSGSVLVVSIASEQAHLYTSPAMSVTIDGAAKGITNSSGLATALPAGGHTIVARKNIGALVSRVASGSERLLSMTFENAPTPGSLTVLTDIDGVSLKLLHGAMTVHEGTSVGNKLDIADLPVGSYTLQATTSASVPVSEQKVVISQGQNTTVTFHLKQNPALIPLRVRTLPGANILVDGKEAGSTGTNGVLLVSPLPTGTHRIEARRHGKAAMLDANLVAGEDKAHVAELKLDAGDGTVLLQLNPADSDVTVYAPNGKQVPITGTHFDLPEGKYHFIARANGYLDRAEAIDVTAESSTPVNLTLAPITIDKTAPSIAGWEAASWTIDRQNHTLTHSSPDIGIYNAQQSQGKYIFSGSIGHAFLFSKPKVEWVAGYRDPNNYLLFSLDRTGLELFTIKAGKRVPNGNRIIFSPMSRYQILLQILPGHIMTSLGDGHKWKLISDWTGLPEDVDAGRFGFRGPVTLNSFSHTP